MNDFLEEKDYLEAELNDKRFNNSILITLGLFSILIFPFVILIKRLKELKKLQADYIYLMRGDNLINILSKNERKVLYDEGIAELNKFSIKYLNSRYIERRNEVLLEELELKPVEYRYNMSSEYLSRLKMIEAKEKQLIKDDEFIIASDNASINTLLDDKDYNRFIKVLIAGFNKIVESEISEVNLINFEQSKKKIDNVIKDYIDILDIFGLGLSKDVKDVKREKLALVVEYNKLVEEEKERVRVQHEKEKEEQLVLKEFQIKLNKIHTDIEYNNIQINENTSRLQVEEDSENISNIQNEIKRLKQKNEELIKEEKRVNERISNSAAGYIYIISNIGSFGKHVYKIGMTRRDDPKNKVKELADSSMPFAFDVHAIIYSPNAYEVEKQLHKELSKYRVNRVNNTKSFFRVSLGQIKELVNTVINEDVEYMDTPQAIEFRETLQLISKEVADKKSINN